MFTYIDILIVVVILLYGWGGYRQGFVRMIVDVLGVIISFVLALRFYNIAAAVLSGLGVNQYLAQPLGFFSLWTILQLFFWGLTVLIFHYVPSLIHENKINKTLGIIPGLLKGVLIVAIFLMIVLILPFSVSWKNLLSKSFVSGELIASTAKVETQMENVFGQLNKTLTFVGTVQETDKNIELNFRTDKFSIDQASEVEMLVMLNEERIKNGLSPLVMDQLIRNVARAHSMDMLQSGYFGHQDLLGQTAFERMNNARVEFTVVGENLALAPSVALAHIGLMNSPSHKANILDPDYKRIGIGILDASPYGFMITQDFAD